MRTFRAGILAPITLAALAACGGHIILSAPDAGPPPNSSSGDGGDSTSPDGETPFPICPAEAPQTGSPCPTANQGCVYENVQENTCASWTCDASQQWTLSTPAGCP